MTHILINGEPGDTISVLDRGLQYGDGLFETLAVVDGEPQQWQRHMRRLQAGCERLAIPVPKGDTLWQQALQLCGGAHQAVLKILITRGTGGRGYRYTAGMEATVILSCSEWPDYPKDNALQGVRLRTCETRLAAQPRLAGIKHLNRLEQVLARNEWQDDAIAEGVMCDEAGRVIEGTMSNLFCIRDGRLITPELSRCGVAGIMRERILEACEAMQLDYSVEALMLEQARQSEEIFITNSLIGVWPVRQWDDTTYPVHGALTLNLINYIKKNT